jgi:mannan endo-1,4-beta-mannosidase
MSNFIQTQGVQFTRHGAPYSFIGANFWIGMHLGAFDRPRLIRELDLMASIGIRNLRIMAAFEGPDDAPWRALPTVQPEPGLWREELLRGLDFLLDEMGKRDMTAVVCLNNFWPWSGGMAQYIAWQTGKPIPYPPPAEGGSWTRYSLFAAKFYRNEAAMAAFEAFIQMLLKRTNHRNKRPYTDDPVIMSWQLANEPRGMLHPKAYRAWITRTASLIKSLDANHLISIGSEGDTASGKIAGTNPLKDHASNLIDYVTCHIWPQNWNWYDPEKGTRSYEKGEKKALAYLEKHIKYAEKLNKPLVLEEFGLARDAGSHDPSGSTEIRNHFYSKMLSQVGMGTLAGANIWAWGGEGRPRSPGEIWQQGDALIGDPPHERQGWYSVYDSDKETLAVIKGMRPSGFL